MKESSLREAMATPPTTGRRAAYTGRAKIWPRNRALKSAVKSGSPACQEQQEVQEVHRTDKTRGAVEIYGQNNISEHA